MGLRELCWWLNTPCGSDAFGDRHWLSQSRQIATLEGRLPDFLGSYEHIDADGQAVAGCLGLPFTKLPRLNARPQRMVPQDELDDEVVAPLKRRHRRGLQAGPLSGSALTVR